MPAGSFSVPLDAMEQIGPLFFLALPRKKKGTKSFFPFSSLAEADNARLSLHLAPSPSLHFPLPGFSFPSTQYSDEPPFFFFFLGSVQELRYFLFSRNFSKTLPLSSVSFPSRMRIPSLLPSPLLPRTETLVIPLFRSSRTKEVALPLPPFSHQPDRNADQGFPP